MRKACYLMQHRCLSVEAQGRYRCNHKGFLSAGIDAEQEEILLYRKLNIGGMDYESFEQAVCLFYSRLLNWKKLCAACLDTAPAPEPQAVPHAVFFCACNRVPKVGAMQRGPVGKNFCRNGMERWYLLCPPCPFERNTFVTKQDGCILSVQPLRS